MHRRTLVTSALATAASLAASHGALAREDVMPATPAAPPSTANQTVPESGYAPVNGLQMYYEIHGQGEPLLLLHGAFGSIDGWGALLPALAEGHQVIAVEFQAHGRTADIDRPFSYDAFVEDIVALMAHLGIAQADVAGYSMGANTGLLLAARHPELVRHLVAISANYRSDGYYPEVWEVVAAMEPEMFTGTPFEDAYRAVAADPEGLPVLVERIKALDAIEYAWPDEEMAAIEAPTLLIIGDSDNVRPEHAVELFRLLGGGVPGDLTGLPASQLAILPGATHITVGMEKPERLVAMIEDFLATPLPEAS